MTIYENLKKDQLTLRKEYAKTKNTEYKDQATVVNLVVSRLSPSGTEDRVATDEEAISTIREFINSNIEVLKNIAASERDHEKARNENEVLQQYLPTQLTDQDIERISKEYIEENNLSGMKNVKTVMNHLKEKYSGSFDSKHAGSIVKNLL